jgi:hypothetical protein
MLLVLLLKERQLQDGASWDTLVTIAVVILLVASAGLVIALIGSRVIDAIRVKRRRDDRKNRLVQTRKARD